MPKSKVRSIRGAEVDFDLLKVKQKIEDRKKPDSVEMREKYIDIRRRRNPRRNVADLVDEQRKNEQEAREKIRQSKEAKVLADAAEPKEEAVEVTGTPEPTTAATKKAPAKKKVVRRKKED